MEIKYDKVKQFREWCKDNAPDVIYETIDDMSDVQVWKLLETWQRFESLPKESEER